MNENKTTEIKEATQKELIEHIDYCSASIKQYAERGKRTFEALWKQTVKENPYLAEEVSLKAVEGVRKGRIECENGTLWFVQKKGKAVRRTQIYSVWDYLIYGSYTKPETEIKCIVSRTTPIPKGSEK